MYIIRIQSISAYKPESNKWNLFELLPIIVLKQACAYFAAMLDLKFQLKLEKNEVVGIMKYRLILGLVKVSKRMS